MAAPPATQLSLGNILRLRPEDSVLVTEFSGTAPATLVLYARGRDETNGQQLVLGASCSIVLDGEDIGGAVLNAGAANYVFGLREAPKSPLGSFTGTWPNVNIGGPSPLPVQLAGANGIQIVDASNTATLPILYLSGASPATGTWRGYAVAAAAGDVEVNGVTLGSATAANQAFAFVLFVAKGSVATLVNCSVLGGGISL